MSKQWKYQDAEVFYSFIIFESLYEVTSPKRKMVHTIPLLLLILEGDTRVPGHIRQDMEA